MPPAIPAIAAVAAAAAAAAGPTVATALGIAGLTIGGISAGTIIGAVLGAVVSIAVSYVGSALLGSTKSPSSGDTAASSSRTEQIRSSIQPHQIVLGSVKVSGTLVYVYSDTNARDGYASALNGNVPQDYKPNQLLYTIVVLAGHPVANIHDITIDDTPLTDPKFSGLAHVELSLGAPDQPANATFVAETAGEWTVNHRLQGRPAIFSIFSFDQGTYSGAPPTSAVAPEELSIEI